MINAQGGINGRKIVLISRDDGYLPPRTVEQTRKLIEQEGVLLIFEYFRNGDECGNPGLS